MVPMRRSGPTSSSGLFVTHDIGKVNLRVLFDNVVVKEADINVRPGHDASKCSASGDGLRRAVVGNPAKFDINVQNAGDGELFVQFMGPAEAKNKCIDNSDGTCSVEYVPPVPGEYTIGICYGKDEDKQHIHGSPFRVIADMPNDPSRIAVSGLRPDTLLEARVGSPVSFSIDASQTEEAPISVTVPPSMFHNRFCE
ncbi:Filamin/ABP280 repeat protein, partial [Ostertagia ostertagi]